MRKDPSRKTGEKKRAHDDDNDLNDFVPGLLMRHQAARRGGIGQMQVEECTALCDRFASLFITLFIIINRITIHILLFYIVVLRIFKILLLLPVLTQIVLPFEVFAADFARVRDLRALVGALVYHEVVRFGEAPLAVFTNELALGPHLPTEVRPTVIVINSHYRKHFAADSALLLTSLCTHRLMVDSQTRRFAESLARSLYCCHSM